MPLRTRVIVVVALLLALFVAVNWTAFMTPATLSMIFGTVQAPLGFVMLVITGLVAALFVAYTLWLLGSVLLETRRMTRELASQQRSAVGVPRLSKAVRPFGGRGNSDARTVLLQAGDTPFVNCLKNFATPNAVYGAFGGITALLLWICLSARIFIVGAPLCVAQTEGRSAPADTARARWTGGLDP